MMNVQWPLYKSVLPRNVAWIDIETIKVAAPEGWPFKERWQPIMLATVRATDDALVLNVILNLYEKGFCAEVRQHLNGINEIRYRATRRFDEMVLRGRFYHARTSFNTVPGPWPNLDTIRCAWTCIRPHPHLRRLRPVMDDVASKEIARGFAKLDRQTVAAHCARDAIEALLDDPQTQLTNRLRLRLEEQFKKEFAA